MSYDVRGLLSSLDGHIRAGEVLEDASQGWTACVRASCSLRNGLSGLWLYVLVGCCSFKPWCGL